LEGFGGDKRKRRSRENPTGVLGIDCYHVDARFSQSIQEIGGFQVKKLALLMGYCLQAIWIRARFGVSNFYYIPAPSQPAPLYRDWLVMVVCRPFFKNVILHWHAAGLGEWLETSASAFTRRVSLLLLGRVGLSIVPCEHHCGDAAKLNPQ